MKNIKDIIISNTIWPLILLLLPTLQQMEKYNAISEVPMLQWAIFLFTSAAIVARFFVSKVGEMTWIKPFAAGLTVFGGLADIIAAHMNTLSPSISLFQLVVACAIAAARYFAANPIVESESTSGQRLQVSSAQKETWIYKHRIVIVLVGLLTIGLLSIEIFSHDKKVSQKPISVNSQTLEIQ